MSSIQTAPVAPYLGGKRLLWRTLVPIIEQIKHTTYAEPFVGMGGVFLRRTVKPRAEVINDINGDIVTLFRILQRHYPQFIETLKFQITSRDDFNRLKKADPATLTDLERAARFLYLQRTVFGGKIEGRYFGIPGNHTARFNLSTLEPMLEDLNERLAGVVIENLPFQDFIKRYDAKATLFYLDPPYWGCEDDYGRDVFSPDDFLSLAKQLTSIKGQFIMSLNDVPDIREIFSAFSLKPVDTKYTVSGKATSAKELIIQNQPRPGAVKAA